MKRNYYKTGNCLRLFSRMMAWMKLSNLAVLGDFWQFLVQTLCSSGLNILLITQKRHRNHPEITPFTLHFGSIKPRFCIEGISLCLWEAIGCQQCVSWDEGKSLLNLGAKIQQKNDISKFLSSEMSLIFIFFYFRAIPSPAYFVGSQCRRWSLIALRRHSLHVRAEFLSRFARTITSTLASGVFLLYPSKLGG